MKTNNRKKIRSVIEVWFRMFNPEDKLTTDDVVKHVRKYVHKNIDPETIRRELRYMRKDGLINYKYVGQKNEKIIEVIK